MEKETDANIAPLSPTPTPPPNPEPLSQTNMRVKGRAELPIGWMYSPDGLRMIQNPREQEMIALALQAKRQGASCVKVAEILAAQGFVNRNGRAQWSASDIQRMLTRATLSPAMQKRKDNMDARADAWNAPPKTGKKKSRKASAPAPEYALQPLKWTSGHRTLPCGWAWSKDGRRIVEEPREQEMIALAKKTYLEGKSYGDIGKTLAQNGFRNRNGNPRWGNKQIKFMLSAGPLGPGMKKMKDHQDAVADALENAENVLSQAGDCPLEDTDPVRWGEAFLYNQDGSKRAYWPHQIEDLRAKETNIVHLDGRDVGKTANLATLALHFAITTKGGAGLIAASLRGQLMAIIEEIERQFDKNPYLEAAIARSRSGQRMFQRSPYPRIAFASGSVLYFRPAGAYGEAFRSLHVDRIWLDEGAWLSEEAWRALRQCLKSGGRMRVYSTPNGVRKSTYYRITQSPNWRVFRWPSWLNPTWDPTRERDLLDFYGGKGSVGWQHEVAGEHGAPSYGAFDPEHFSRCSGEVPEYRIVTITAEELGDCTTEEQTESRLETLLGITPAAGRYWIGGDLGYTRDPTEIVVFREEEGVAGKEPAGAPVAPPCLRLVLRVHLESVGYPQIAQCLSVLNAIYDPIGIGVDNGGNGLAVVQELMTLDKYRWNAGKRRAQDAPAPGSRFEGRLFGFDFGGVSAFELADGTQARKRTKELMTSLINGALQRGELLFPSQDRDIEDQFLTQTYSLTNGVIVYSKGNDHIIDAVRCAMLVREKLREGGLFDTAPKGGRSHLPVIILGVPRRRDTWYAWER